MIFGFGGICYLIVGIKATKAIINAAILAILSANTLFWKNIPKFITPKSHKGKKIVAIVTIGYLYTGTVKWAYWKNFTLFDFENNAFYIYFLPIPPSIKLFGFWLLTGDIY